MSYRRTLLLSLAAMSATIPAAVAVDIITTSTTTTTTGNDAASGSPGPLFLPFSWKIEDTDSILQYPEGTWDSHVDSDTTSTTAAGATMSFSFVGTDISILGTTDPASGLLLTVDDTTTELSASSGPALAEAHVPLGYHIVSLRLLGGKVSISSVNVTTGMVAEA
jgi:hypothetical protein